MLCGRVCGNIDLELVGDDEAQDDEEEREEGLHGVGEGAAVGVVTSLDQESESLRQPQLWSLQTGSLVPLIAVLPSLFFSSFFFSCREREREPREMDDVILNSRTSDEGYNTNSL